MPVGQFGTRLQGGKDAASPRYIFTMLRWVRRFRVVGPRSDGLQEKKCQGWWCVCGGGGRHHCGVVTVWIGGGMMEWVCDGMEVDFRWLG